MTWWHTSRRETHFYKRGGGRGISCQVNFAGVKFAAGNFAETPRNVVVCRALQTRRSSATCANFAEDPRFGVGNFAANLKRGISRTKSTAPEIPPPPRGWGDHLPARMHTPPPPSLRPARTHTSIRLNSSKQDHEPVWARPLNMRPMAW